MLEALKSLVAALGIDWVQFKDFVERTYTISPDALHVLVGVLLQLLLATLPRSSLAKVWPWLVVLLGALLNEWNDLRDRTWSEVGMQRGESVKDVALTMLLPTILFALARWRPQLFGLRQDKL